MDKDLLRVALLEDEPGVRERLCRAIDADPGIHLAHASGSAGACTAWLAQHEVDVLLVDLQLPDGSGIDVIRFSRRVRPHCDVMVVTIFADEANMLEAFAAGARGYLLKDGTESDLARHVRNLRAGGSPMSPIIARRLLQVWREDACPSGPVPFEPEASQPLTPREVEVLGLVARGFTYEEVGLRMQVSTTTVRTHVRNIYSKLDVHSKTEAVFEARAMGWLK